MRGIKVNCTHSMSRTQCSLKETGFTVDRAAAVRIRREGVWGNKVIVPRVLNLGTIWMWVVSFTRRPLIPRKRTPDTHWFGGWVGHRAGLDAATMRRNPCPCRESSPGFQPSSLVTVLNKLSLLRATNKYQQNCVSISAFGRTFAKILYVVVCVFTCVWCPVFPPGWIWNKALK